MSRCNLLFIALIVLLSSPVMAGVVVPGEGSTETQSQFLEWKTRMRQRAVAICETCEPNYHEDIARFAELIRKNDEAGVMGFLTRSDTDLLRRALSPVYVFSHGTRIRVPHTALQLAVIHRSLSVVRNLLIFAAAYPEMAKWILQVDGAGQSALHMAIYLDDYETVEAFTEILRRKPSLLNNLFIRNGIGETPLEAARRYRRWQIATLIEEALAAPQEDPLPRDENTMPEPSALLQLRNAVFYVTPALVAVSAICFLFHSSAAEK